MLQSFKILLVIIYAIAQQKLCNHLAEATSMVGQNDNDVCRLKFHY